MAGSDDMVCSDIDITRLAMSVELLAAEVKRDREERAKQDERHQATSVDHEGRLRKLEINQTRLMAFMAVVTSIGVAALTVISRLISTVIGG